MESSDAKLWKYIYYDQMKPSKNGKSTNYLETSTTDDTSGVDQLCDQLLLHQNDLQRQRNLEKNLQKNLSKNLHDHQSNHQFNKSHNHPNYSKLQFGQSDSCIDSNLFSKRTKLKKKLIFYKYLAKFSKNKFNSFNLLLLIICLIGFICILKAFNYFELFNSNHLSTSSLPFSSISPAAFHTNFSLFNHLHSTEQFTNDHTNAFDRVLTIQTDCARYIGMVQESAFEFLGLQYAKAPLKELRFQPTVPIWKDSNLCKPKQIKKAKKFSSECFQLNPFNKKFYGKEDCLYLNIWTPRLDSSAFLDVMIYFHGGFLQFGGFGSGHLANGNAYLSPSASLAKKLNIVFVSFNYRLDAFGFFDPKQFLNNSTIKTNENKDEHRPAENRTDYGNEAKNSPNMGNYGLHDQMIAVEWVKRNIRQFGGNPNRLTVFGSDGGAASILALLSYDKFRKSISKVWLAGPAVYLNKQFSLNKFLSKNNRIDQRTKSSIKFSACKTIECFQNLPAKDVILGFLANDEAEFRINDQNDLPINGIYPTQWIQVDNNLVNDAYPFDRELNYNKLQFLIGSSENSIEWWPGPNDLRKWSWLQYAKYVSNSLDSFGNSSISQLALQFYRPEIKNFKLINNYVNSRKYRTSFDLFERFNLDQNLIDKQKNSNELNQLNNLDTKQSKLSPEQLYTRMVSDIKQLCPLNIVSKNLDKFHNSTAFRYVATSGPSYPVKLFGHNSRYGFHLWDLIAFFDQVHVFIEQPTRNDLLFVKQMQNMVMNFLLKKDEHNARQEDEKILEIKNLVDFRDESNNIDDLISEIDQNSNLKINKLANKSIDKIKNKLDSNLNDKWLAYPNTIALINEEIKFVKKYKFWECQFWESIQLDRYAWIC